MIYINPPNSNITGKMIRILFESGAPGVSYFQTKPMLATSLRTASGDFKLIWQERSCAVWILRFFGEGLGYPVLSPFPTFLLIEASVLGNSQLAMFDYRRVPEIAKGRAAKDESGACWTSRAGAVHRWVFVRRWKKREGSSYQYLVIICRTDIIMKTY